jgi:hypothetical protein
MLALVTATIRNTIHALFAKKGSKPKLVSPQDLIPMWGDWDCDICEEGPFTQAQTVEEMKRILVGIAVAQNKRSAPPQRGD